MKFSWKLLLIVIAIVIAVVLMFVFGFQGVQNTAISYEEQISTAQSDIKVQVLGMLGYEQVEYSYLTYNVSEDAPSNLFGD